MATAYSSIWLRDHTHSQACLTTAEGKVPHQEAATLKLQREEQCNALVAAQESAIMQLLLEICLPTPDDTKVGEGLSLTAQNLS